MFYKQAIVEEFFFSVFFFFFCSCCFLEAGSIGWIPNDLLRATLWTILPLQAQGESQELALPYSELQHELGFWALL